MNARKYYLLLLLLLSSGCTSNLEKNYFGEVTTITRINSTVEYVGPNNVQLTKDQYPNDVVLMFPYVYGAIFGTPTDTPGYITKVDDKLNFSLDLMQKINEIEQASTPLTEEWKNLGLAAKPGQARITRIGTFPYSYTTANILGRGGFVNPASRNTMILVYVDRPCIITGEIEQDNNHYSHYLKFSAKGFHWVEVIKRSKHEYILRTYSGENNINFSIHIENLQLI